MKIVFEFTGRETAKINAVMAALGMSVSEATIETPKRKKPEPKPKPEPEATAGGNVAIESVPVADTRLNIKEDKPESKPRRGGGGKRKFKKLPKQTWPIADCLFVGMFVASTGRECGIAGVSMDTQTGNVRLAFIDKDWMSASTEANWFVSPDAILDRMEATVENAKLIKTCYN